MASSFRWQKRPPKWGYLQVVEATFIDEQTIAAAIDLGPGPVRGEPPYVIEPLLLLSDAKGRERWRLGPSNGDPWLGPIRDIARCPWGICVLHTNSGRGDVIDVWTPEGTHARRVSLAALLGKDCARGGTMSWRDAEGFFTASDCGPETFDPNRLGMPLPIDKPKIYRIIRR